MSASPALLPVPLSEEKSAAVARLVEDLDSERLWWLSGYFAGLARVARASQPVRPIRPATSTGGSEATPLTIVYGSQTGNARRLAEALAEQAAAAGVAARLMRADGYPVREIKHERLLYLILSTQGDGEPSDDARGLFDFLESRRVQKLDSLRYAVLGLGDSSYPQFCAAARRLDERLAELGAQRLLDRGEADVDIASVATPWLQRAIDAVQRVAHASPAPSGTVVSLRNALASSGSRERPYAAEIVANLPLTFGGDKDVRHIELALEETGLSYEPGDALGLWPVNPAPVVDATLDALGLDAAAPVTIAGDTLALRTWLSERRELTRLARPFLQAHAARARSAELDAILDAADAKTFGQWMRDHQVVDVLRRYPATWSAQSLVEALHPLAPRLYSIASSQKQVGDEAHLTVAHVRSMTAGGWHWGAASHQLATGEPGARANVYVERNDRFRLPLDHARDVVMIGPGTGVAPFRAFLQEREAIGATGRNWLVFGNPRLRNDFLYQVEWLRALETGRLHRLDLAFSRDQDEKLYVQQRLREHGRRLYDWLEQGAYVYVCGAIAMAKDVHAALVEIIAEHGGRSPDAAAEYVDALQRDGRYARDAY